MPGSRRPSTPPMRKDLPSCFSERIFSSVDVLLANPRGFCAGVERAIEIVERALAQFGAPIYVRHEIVHNKYVVADLRAKGAVFVEEPAEAPTGTTATFTAHRLATPLPAQAPP